MATDSVQLGDKWGGGFPACGGAVDGSPAMACGSAEYSWTSNTPQSKDALSFFSLEAEGATLNRPWEAQHDDTSQTLHSRTRGRKILQRKSDNVWNRPFSNRILNKTCRNTICLSNNSPGAGRSQRDDLQMRRALWLQATWRKLNIVHLHILPTVQWCKAGRK